MVDQAPKHYLGRWKWQPCSTGRRCGSFSRSRSVPPRGSIESEKLQRERECNYGCDPEYSTVKSVVFMNPLPFQANSW